MEMINLLSIPRWRRSEACLDLGAMLIEPSPGRFYKLIKEPQMYHLHRHISLMLPRCCHYNVLNFSQNQTVCEIKINAVSFFSPFNIWVVLRNTRWEKTGFLCWISTSLFTLGAGIEPLRAGSTQSLFFINHSMPVSIHPPIRGPCKNTPRAPRSGLYVQQQHDAAGTDAFLTFP